MAGGVHRLANQLLQHWHQLLRIGVIEEEHPHVAASGRSLIKIRHRARQLGQRYRITAQHDAVAGIDRRYLPAPVFGAALPDLAQAGGNFARAGVFQIDHPHGGPILIDLPGERTHTGNIIGKIGNNHGIAGAVGGHLAFTGNQRAQRFNRRCRIDIVERDDRGCKAIAPQAGRCATRSLGGGPIGWCHPERAAGGRGDHKAVGAQGRKEQFEITGLIKRAFGNHRHLALHARIDDERAAGCARRILNEGAHIGIAQIDRLLRQQWDRDHQQRKQGRGKRPFHFRSCRGTSSPAGGWAASRPPPV